MRPMPGVETRTRYELLMFFEHGAVFACLCTRSTLGRIPCLQLAGDIGHTHLIRSPLIDLKAEDEVDSRDYLGPSGLRTFGDPQLHISA